MQWPMNETTKDMCAAFVEAVTGQQPTFHEVTVPLQRTNECAARSLDQLVLNVLQIARGLCPRSLVQPARNVVNDNGDALRLLVGLNYLWSVASGGYFDYDEIFRIATSGNPARAIDLISSDSDKESDWQDPPADSSTDGGASRPSRGIITETLLYTPNTAEHPKKRLRVQPGQTHSDLPHGTLEGTISFGTGGRRQEKDIRRHAFETRGAGSCGFIFVGKNAADSASDTVFMERLKKKAPNVHKRLQEIADLRRSDRVDCPNIRAYICLATLEMPKEKSSSFWSSDPKWKTFDTGLKRARAHKIAHDAVQKITDHNDLSRGEKWAIAVMNPKVQLEHGYLLVLLDHFDNQVGFLVIQRRRSMEGESGAQPTTKLPFTYFHCELNDVVPDNPVLMWPVLHNVSDDDELGERNHFEVMCADSRSSIFFVDPVNDVQHNNEKISIFVDNGNASSPAGDGPSGPLGGSLKQSFINDFFRAQDSEQRNNVLQDSKQRDQETSGQSQVDSIVDRLRNGRQAATAFDRVIRLYCSCSVSLERPNQESLRSILKRPQSQGTSISVDDLLARVHRYIDSAIAVASAVISEPAHYKLRPLLQVALLWLWEITTAGKKPSIAPEETVRGWRETIRPLLQDSASSAAAGFGQSVSEKAPADSTDLEATAKQVAPECCFKCGLTGTQNLWGCCHVSPDGTTCRIGYCVDCMYKSDTKQGNKPDDWCCRIHSKHGAPRLGLKMNRSVCWECPRDSEDFHDSKAEFLNCPDCGILLCKMHGIVSGVQSCFFCGERGVLAAKVSTELRRRLKKFTTFPASMA
jgi:hypothetical protein